MIPREGDDSVEGEGGDEKGRGGGVERKSE